MSDEAPKPPKPMTKTSAVPLRKETVRVTLKASDADASAPTVPTSAPAAPLAPTPMAPPAPKPPTSVQGGPPAPSGPPRPPAPTPAPTVALRTAAGTVTGGALAPAPTVALRTGGAAPIALQTQPLSPQGTQALPKATVPLAGTQQLGRPTGLQTNVGTVATFDDEEEAEDTGTLTVVLAILSLLAAIGALAFQVMTSKVWKDVTVGVSRTWSDFFSLGS